MMDSRLGRPSLQHLRPRRQVGLEPVDRLLAPAGPGGIVERRIILALAASGQRRGAGGVVAVLGLHVVGQFGWAWNASVQNRAEAPWSFLS